ncbi:MAG: hypothetical protein ABIP95_06610 [Pelobium sp.]
MKQSIYVKCEHCLFSRLAFFIFLASAAAITVAAYFLSYSLLISELSAYIIYSFSLLVTVFSLYHLYKEKKSDYIYLTDEEIWFKEKNQNQTVCLKFTNLNHFETRFSEIIFFTTSAEKMVMPLNAIGDEKKRWEIKEFLRNHITQTRDPQQALLAIA